MVFYGVQSGALSSHESGLPGESVGKLGEQVARPARAWRVFCCLGGKDGVAEGCLAKIIGLYNVAKRRGEGVWVEIH